MLYNRQTNQALSVSSNNTANGAALSLGSYTAQAYQQFEVVNLYNGYYAILPYHSGKTLDLWDHSTANGADIKQYDYIGSNNQQWQITATGDGFYKIESRLSAKAWEQPDGTSSIKQYTYQNTARQQWRFELLPEPNRRLVWSDEFNGSGLPDNAYWSYEKGLVRNNEAQYYTQARPENVNIANGVLTITARREQYENAQYTSASIHTRGKVSWTYGRFEMRARIDARAGLWPAFWLLGNGKWPEGGEIDVMEYYQNKILANVAWKSPSSDQWNASWDSSTRSLSNLRLQHPDWEARFHTWRMDWDANTIRLYVDDILMNSTSLSGTKNPDGSNPFIDKPFYILINLAIGGNNGGDPAGTAFPSKYEIDYVRVYQ